MRLVGVKRLVVVALEGKKGGLTDNEIFSDPRNPGYGPTTIRTARHALVTGGFVKPTGEVSYGRKQPYHSRPRKLWTLAVDLTRPPKHCACGGHIDYVVTSGRVFSSCEECTT